MVRGGKERVLVTGAESNQECFRSTTATQSAHSGSEIVSTESRCQEAALKALMNLEKKLPFAVLGMFKMVEDKSWRKTQAIRTGGNE
jgi:hypothetical protein